MTVVFLDTVGLLALWDTSDQWHGPAEAAFTRLVETRATLVTTTFVLLECGNAAARRPYRHAVDRLREKMESSGRLVVPANDDWRDAWAAYQKDAIGGAGIVDHVSFSVMRRQGIGQAFTNDGHFRDAGFEILF